MRIITLVAAGGTVAVLNLILGLAVLGLADSVAFLYLLDAFHLFLPVSGCLMLVACVRARQTTGAVLSAGILAGALVVATLGVAGVSFSRGLHLIIDLAALNAYLFTLPIVWRSAGRAA